jgi:hypothetical protein
LFWLNDLGFGTPLPIGTRLDVHPLFALAAVAPLRFPLSLVLVAHMALSVIYFLRLAAVSGIRSLLRTIVVVLYVFSVVAMSLFYETDWVSYVVGWSLLPVLVFYLRRAVLDGEAISRFWFTAARLGLLFGFWILNSHPGYVTPLLVALTLYVVIAAPPHKRVYLCLVTAAMFCVSVCAERIYFFASEMRLFPASLGREQPGYTIAEYAEAVVSPWMRPAGDMRLPFIGLVMGVAAAGAPFWLRRTHDRHVLACIVCFFACVVMSVVPPELASMGYVTSGTWIFRDPMILFGLLIGALVLQRGLDSPKHALHLLVWTGLAVQVGQQAATLVPGAREFRDHLGVLQFYKYQGRPAGLGTLLVDNAGRFGSRLYMSAQTQLLARDALSGYGIHTLTDLVFLGVNPVNGWFKNISMDRLHPSVAMMHGFIRGQADVLENETLLNVLGINLVLTTSDEPVSGRLEEIGRAHVDTSPGRFDLILFANHDAWPKAVMLDGDAAQVRLSRRPGCEHAAALCRDYQEIARRRLADDVSLTADNGHYVARFKPASDGRLLFVSTMYRREWRAASAVDGMTVTPVAEAFIGVTVPPGVDHVELSFTPSVRIALTGFSATSMLGLLTLFCAASWRLRRPTPTNGIVPT